jgi:hypothetical protein
LRRPIAFVSIIALSACHDRVFVRAPIPTGLGMNVKSTVLFVEQGTTLRAFGLDENGQPSAMGRLDASPVQLTVLLYPYTLDELQLSHGELPVLGDNVPSRPLPTPDQIYTAQGVNGAAPSWTPVHSLADDHAIASFAIPAFDFERCEQRGGCPLAAPSTVCKLPCPAPDVARPQDPLAPDLLNPPSLGLCPTGWSPTSLSGASDVSGCVPRSGGLCSLQGTASFLGSSSCVAIGDPCPAGDFADVDVLYPNRPKLYVKRGAPAGGSGTMASPYASIAEALAAAVAGDVIALSGDVFNETPTITASIAIAGACVGKTTIGAASISAAGAELRDLAIVGGGLTVSGAGVSANLMSVEIAHASSGITVSGGARLQALGLSIHDTLSYGVHLQNQASATLAHGAIDAYGAAAIGADAAGSIFLVDVAIRNEGGVSGPGIVLDGSSLLGQAVLIDGASSSGLLLQNRSSAMFATLVIRNTHGSTAARAIDARSGSTGALSHLLIMGDTAPEHVHVDTGAKLTLDDVVLVTTPTSATMASAMSAASGGMLEVHRARVAVRASNPIVITGATADLFDLDLRRESATDALNFGIYIDHGSLSVTRGLLQDHFLEVIHACGTPAQGCAPTDTKVALSSVQLLGEMSTPMGASLSGVVTLAKSTIGSISGTGLTLIGPTTTASITSLLVHGAAGDCIDVLDGATIKASRVHIDGACADGLKIKSDTGTSSAALEDIFVSGAQAGIEVDCGLTQNCVDFSMSRAQITGSLNYGFICASTSKASLSDITIDHTGVNGMSTNDHPGYAVHAVGKTNLLKETMTQLDVHNFRWSQSAGAGLWMVGSIENVELPGVAHLDSGIIASTPSGIVLARGADPSPLLLRVSITATTALDFR